MKKSKGARTDLTSPHAEGRSSEFKQAKENANISDSQGEKWQKKKLADIPDKDFEGGS